MTPEITAARRPRRRAGRARASSASSLSLLVTLWGLAPLAAVAQGVTAPQLQPVVVSASGFAQSLADAIPNTTVHTREDIASSGHTDLPGLLAGAAGIDLVRNGGAGGLTATFMRGAEARQVLVLVDGVRIDSATSGTARLENLVLDQVERVEVVRGNVSALYGSAAVGGVVQIFTRRGEGPPRGNAAIGVGSRGEERASFGSSGVFGVDGATDYSLQASRHRTDGKSAIDTRLLPDADPDRDGFRNTSLTGSIGHRLSSRHRIGARAYWSESRVELDDSFMVGPAAVVQQESRLTVASAWWEARPTARWRSTLRASIADERSLSRYESGGEDPFDTRRNEVEWRNELALGPGTASLGLASIHERIATGIDYDRHRRRSHSAFAAYALKRGPHQAEAAVRYDDFSDVGDATTGSLGYGYAIDDRWKVLGRVATAFNAPTFNQLFYPGFSNPGLDPERARSIELGVQYERDAVLLRATAFRTRYTDMIDSPPPDFLPANVASAQVQGLELTANGVARGWRFSASATFQSPTNRQTGETLLRRAKRFGALDVARRLGAWEAGADLAWGGSRRDFRIDTFAPVVLESRARLGLRLQRRILPDTSLVMRLDNVTDDDTPIAHGYLPTGRSLFVMLRWQPS